MPNWCENDLYIEGPDTEIERFLKKAGSSDSDDEDQKILDFNNFVPYPTVYENADTVYAREQKKQGTYIPKDENGDAIKDGYNNGGYDWCCDHWGTKWNAVDVEHDWDYQDSGGTCSIYFMTFKTAWSPPNPVIQKMSEMFPNLKFTLRYFEMGWGFNGMFVMENGEKAADVTGKYFGNRGG